MFVPIALNSIAPSLSERLTLTIQVMCQAIARRGAKDWANSAMFILVWGRLNRMGRRFEALAALVRAGRLPSQPHIIPRTRPPRSPAPIRQQPLPSGFAWLLRLVPEVAAGGSQLQHLLGDPEMAALLKAAPQVGRILRPLCRMLGVAPGPAALPPSRPSALPPSRPSTPDRSPQRSPQADPTETPFHAEPPLNTGPCLEPDVPDRHPDRAEQI